MIFLEKSKKKVIDLKQYKKDKSKIDRKELLELLIKVAKTK